MRVLLAEDHPLMQEKIAALLSTEYAAIEIVGRGDEVLAAVLRVQPDLVVLDVSLPGQNGLQVLPELRDRHPDLPVVILTSHDEPIYRAEAARRGADAYVLKGKAADELMPAVRQACSLRRSILTPVRQRA